MATSGSTQDVVDQHRILFISDESWERLITIATERNYVPQKLDDNGRPRGMHRFIHDLMDAPKLFDTRPDIVKADDTTREQARYAPEWIKYRPRRKRRVKVTNHTLVQACSHAYMLRISFPECERMLGAPDIFEGTKCLSVILEAFGAEWISDHVSE